MVELSVLKWTVLGVSSGKNALSYFKYKTYSKFNVSIAGGVIDNECRIKAK
jgi:hypothetical protein